MTSPCSICGYSSRLLYGPKKREQQVPWIVICSTNWGAELLQCPSCGQLWMRIYYEPWGSYPHSVPWPFDVATWKVRADPGRGSGRDHFRLGWWHHAQIHELMDSSTSEWHELYLSEGVTTGCLPRLKLGITSAMLLNGDGELSYDDIVAR